MKANTFIRAVVSLGFGAVAYFVFTINGTSQAAESLQAVPEVEKIVIIAKAPKAQRNEPPHIEKVEKFVERVVETTEPKPTPSRTPKLREREETPSITKAEVVPDISESEKTLDIVASAADERQEKLEADAKEQETAAKIAKVKAIELAKQKAKELAEKKAKEKAERERQEKEERERKEKEAAAARRARQALQDVPVPGANIGTPFGATGHWARYHTGADFRASYGTPVRAVADGTIIFAGNKGNWAGNHVVIRHASGRKTLYAHLSSISRSSGHVNQGDRIGRVGATGRAFGAHLHLELYPAGATPGDVYSAVNPVPWLRNLGIHAG